MKKISTLLFLTLLFASLKISAQVNLQSGLIAAWLMDNSTVDSTSNHLDLTAYGSPTGAYNRFGTANSAYSLDNFNPDYFLSSMNALLSPTELTLSAWVNLPNVTFDQKIAGKAVVGGGYLLGVDSGKIDAEIWDLSAVHYRLKANGVVANTWTHLAMTFKANDKLKVYINGVVADSIVSGTTGCGTTFTWPFTVGGAPWQPTALNTTGWIDDIYLYNRVVNDAEMFALYSLLTSTMNGQPVSKINSIYPVPVHDGILTVDFADHINGTVTIRVADALGRIAYSSDLLNPQKERIDLSRLQKGYYTISIANEHGVEAHKLVIN